MIALVLEKQGMPVENRVQLGPDQGRAHGAPLGRDRHLSRIHRQRRLLPRHGGRPGLEVRGIRPSTRVKRLDREKHNLVWLDRAPANNTWLIAVRGDVARRENLATMEDFAKLAGRAGALKLAGSAEFVESPAALPSFERVYGFKLPRDQIVVLPGGDTAVTMRAAAQSVSGVNAAMVYGTDGAIAALDLVVMDDTKGAQIVYEPAPVVRAEVLQNYPADRARPGARLRARFRCASSRSSTPRSPSRASRRGTVAQRYLEQEGLLR